MLPLLLDIEPGESLRACIVGLACGVNAAQWHHFYAELYDLHIEGAELDPAVIDLGRRYFRLPDENAPWLRILALDGRSMLERVPEETRYHAIVLDAFANELYVPFHLATLEFMELCERRLDDGGILAMNVYARGDDAPNLEAIENTMAHVFDHVMRIPHYDTGGYLLLARRGETPLDTSRLAPEAIEARFEAWPGFERWSRTAAWDDLVALADGIRRTAADRGHEVALRPAGRVLTDDHAPLEWLTDRFLRDSEEDLFATGGTRSLAISALRARQSTLLLLVGLVWAVALLGVARVVAR